MGLLTEYTVYYNKYTQLPSDCLFGAAEPWFPGTGHSTQKRPYKDHPSLHRPFLCYRHFYATYWLSKLKQKWWSNSIFVAFISINWRLWVHIYNQKWYGLPWLQHGGCIICFKQSHHNSRHCGRNITARSQNIVALCSDFDLLLTYWL